MNIVPATKICKDAECLARGKPQLIGAFPVNRRLPDGFHRYCRICCVRRVHAYRKKVRAQRVAQGRSVLPGIVRRKQPIQDRDTRVFLAVRGGARTQKQIKRAAKIQTDEELGISLAVLMIDRGWIVRRKREDETIYIENPNLIGEFAVAV